MTKAICMKRRKNGMKNSISTTPGPAADFSEDEKIDKKSYLPAYAQISRILKQRISKGIYAPGSRLPSEASIANSFGISAMTSRQAIGILAEEGLVDRIQGRGTFVKRLKFTYSSFGLDSLRKVFMDRKKLEVRIINAKVMTASENIEKRLELEPGSSVILVERLIFHDKKPVIYQISYALAEPESPFVETMLDTDVLTGLLLEKDFSSFKKAELRLLPSSLNKKDAALLNLKEGESVFRLEHTYYDFKDVPSAFGWFLITPEKMPLISRMGVWHD